MPAEPLAVTWSAEPSDELIADARRVANRWRLPIFERARKRGLGRQLGVVADTFLVRSARGWRLEDRLGVLEVSPGLAMLRRKRLATNEIPDRLLRQVHCRAGETIVDATVGLAADARLLATGVGRAGRVIGLETSLPLAVLLAEGLPHEAPWPDTAPIEIVHTSAEAWLAAQPSRSVDVVFFDPMFEKTKTASPAFTQLRRFAVNEPITRRAIDEARRIARRLVLMKSDDPRIFPALGLEAALPESNVTIYWGRSITA